MTGSSDVVEYVVSVWRTVLEEPDVFADDDFWVLGGDSLRMLEVITAIEEDTGVSVPVDYFVREATPTALAAFIDQARGASTRAA